ncbi:MAG: CbiX/SirB N-terminal domain-containing protein [Chloroherpetonaceae bacterium]|nr:CbiX/SirB N-terminal domain-containing protein [Chthonomonadaceae bacterium]MDW8207658.1 CbiX/SirB N-terminal domain-containing protein [Chloroherpetonaceae bacterium]
MNAIILFSHGSLLCGAEQALQAHAEHLRRQGLAPLVRIGFLNYTEPLFPQTVAECVAQGATHILVVPYFLVPGYFVRVDLPRLLDEARARFPSVTFTVTDAIGYDERLADALIASAQAARPLEHERDVWKQAAAFCRRNPECPLFATPRCPATGSE